MERRKFIKNCCYLGIGLPLSASLLQACGAIYYASSSREGNRLIVPLSEFEEVKGDKIKDRTFVLVNTDGLQFPIGLYKQKDGSYVASLLKCTHRGCELSVGGGIYTCPCHGAEFSNDGKLLQGPAEQDLKTYRTEIQNENIYIHLS